MGLHTFIGHYLKEVYKSLCKDSEFEMKVFLFPNIRRFLALYNILIIKML